jgi:glutathione peroxidase
MLKYRIVFICLLTAFIPALVNAEVPRKTAIAHDFIFNTIDGDPLPLRQYAGQPILIVNTASRCGFTHQYGNLQSLWEDYRSRGLVVIGVPSNDFGGQEPGSNSEIKEFCEVNFDVDFPLTAKEHVRGESAHPFFQWAMQQLGPEAAPRWNFHKYLVGSNGQVLASFSTNTSPTSNAVTKAVESALIND